jgi:hypothetical protein
MDANDANDFITQVRTGWRIAHRLPTAYVVMPLGEKRAFLKALRAAGLVQRRDKWWEAPVEVVDAGLEALRAELDAPRPEMARNTAVPQQHTPHPWTWEFSGTMGRWTLLGSQGKPVEVGGPPGRELSADQKLIASAPVLRNAVREALAVLDDPTGDSGDVLFNAGRAERILRRALEG